MKAVFPPIFPSLAFLIAACCLIFSFKAEAAICGSPAWLGSCSTPGTIDFLSGTYNYCDGVSWFSMQGDSPTTSCTDEGKFEYNAGTSNYRYCDGIDWWPVSNGGTLTACSIANQIEYQSDTLMWCDGANWIEMTKCY